LNKNITFEKGDTMSEHFPEPWHIKEYQVCAADERTVCIVLGPEPYDAEAARRIVVCVNACAGITTEILETGHWCLTICESEELNDGT